MTLHGVVETTLLLSTSHQQRTTHGNWLLASTATNSPSLLAEKKLADLQ